MQSRHPKLVLLFLSLPLLLLLSIVYFDVVVAVKLDGCGDDRDCCG
jgi:hypothetical protein